MNTSINIEEVANKWVKAQKIDMTFSFCMKEETVVFVHENSEKVLCVGYDAVIHGFECQGYWSTKSTFFDSEGDVCFFSAVNMQ